jgi:hypothetical protein
MRRRRAVAPLFSKQAWLRHQDRFPYALKNSCPLAVVKLIDEFLPLRLQILQRGVSRTTDLLALQRAHEALAVSVLPRSARLAHADRHLFLFQSPHLIVAGILAAAVGMMHQSRRANSANSGQGIGSPEFPLACLFCELPSKHGNIFRSDIGLVSF